MTRKSKHLRMTEQGQANLKEIADILGIDDTAAIHVSLAEYARYLKSGRTIASQAAARPNDETLQSQRPPQNSA